MSQRFRVDHVRVQTTGCPGSSLPHSTQTNVWLIGDDRDVVIIDPAGAHELVAGAVGTRQITAVICTQGHRAHIAAAMMFGEEFSAPVLIHPADHAAWQAVHGERRYWRLDDGQRVGVAGEEIRVLHTPTTTLGSVTLHIARHALAFTGDALIQPIRAVERPHASQALDRFAALHPDTRIHPGHGNSYLLGRTFIQQTHRADRQSA
ncbi:MBL fold metallo-hydrolase [Rhodococcus sp. APC 3903]|uniref:MBL fold metallo-hydrolase n=1 Tax=Rhodococcus sp. APC 3903 TaxID=3035193 RepID=UPI0025B60BA0|nr:MBL fold metallo-hydrolase [Rhodococcus sp. APC 3903]MDN3460716.1 MBL fold metallo-hydrolase [Rhodococcus sp. APC 3903]